MGAAPPFAREGATTTMIDKPKQDHPTPAVGRLVPPLRGVRWPLVPPRARYVCLAGLLFLCTACDPIERQRNLHGYLPLHEAVRENNPEEARRLIVEERAPVDAGDTEGVTPLHLAARDGRAECAELLLQYYADPNRPTRKKWNPLHVAAWNDHEEVVELLMQYDAIAKFKTPNGWSPVHMAAIRGNVAIIDTVLRDWKTSKREGKPALDDKDNKKNAPLHYAIRKGHEDVAAILVTKGADINLQDADGNTPLHLLVGRNMLPLARDLLLRKADLTITNGDRKTALALAMESEDHDLGKLLWERGARQ